MRRFCVKVNIFFRIPALFILKDFWEKTMREFLILIGELLFIAILQVLISTALEESGPKWLIKTINISCIVICYFLLFRYVYNLVVGELVTFINFF